MASESVKKILEAESRSDKKNADVSVRSEEIVREAERYSALAIQKKLSDAAVEVGKIHDAYNQKTEIYSKQAESECQKKIDEIKAAAENNMTKAVDAVIEKYF